MKNIPVTVVSGALGAGKTTVLLNLVKQLSPEYKSVWLKNEYGDVNIDTELAGGSNIQTMEVLNGCLCCVLIGKLKNAIVEIVQQRQPERIFIETAGTAYPYPIVAEINEIPGVKLDGLIIVVDALNFNKFKDKSPLAREQGDYIDLIVVNKTGLVDAQSLDDVMDDLYDLYPKVPKVQTASGILPLDILIGLDPVAAKLKAVDLPNAGHIHHPDEVEVFSFELGERDFSKSRIEELMKSLDKEDYYRVKGILKINGEFMVLNYVLGRFDLQDLPDYAGESKITFMGRGIKQQEQAMFEKLKE